MRRYSSLQNTITVLDFGRPVHLRRHHRGRAFGPSFYGVSLFRRRGFATVGDVGEASQAYAQGVLNCTKSRWDIHLRIAIGTSNWGTAVTRGHGRAWAKMVNQANDWIQARGFSRKIDFAGANDIELSWNSPRRTRNWVDGYESAAMYPYYNYGAADACPPRGVCAGAWTLEDVWYVSWGALHAWPLPEIYTPNSSQAQQWYNLALYSYRRHGSQMAIAGVMSQRGACIAARDPCRGMNNSPHRAWHQLFNLLNRDPRTRQQLQWVTDIR